MNRVWIACGATLLMAAMRSPARAATEITGERKQWHDVVLTFDGPAASESGEPNPFFFYRLDVTFTKGAKRLTAPGYFAADGNAAETGSTRGSKWRVHFVPDETGEWSYVVSFRKGEQVSVADDPKAGTAVAPDGATGRFTIGPSDKKGRDHRRLGTLRYVGGRYQQYAGTGEYFIQTGTQSPENLLGYADFDDTVDHGGAPNKLRDGVHHASVDEQERPVKIEKGVLVSSHADMVVDEGAELKLSVAPAAT